MDFANLLGSEELAEFTLLFTFMIQSHLCYGYEYTHSFIILREELQKATKVGHSKKGIKHMVHYHEGSLYLVIYTLGKGEIPLLYHGLAPGRELHISG